MRQWKKTNRLQSRWQYFVISWSKYYFKCHGSNEGAILKLMRWVNFPNHLVVSSEPCSRARAVLCTRKSSSLLTYQVILWFFPQDSIDIYRVHFIRSRSLISPQHFFVSHLFKSVTYLRAFLIQVIYL